MMDILEKRRRQAMAARERRAANPRTPEQKAADRARHAASTPEQRAAAVERTRLWRLANPERDAANRLRIKLANAKPARSPGPCAIAKANGESTYQTGKPCKVGHLSRRYVRNNKCIECTRVRANAAYKANPSVHNARTRSYYAANRESILAAGSQKPAEKKAEAVARTAAWRKANPERIRALRWARKAKAKSAAGHHSGDEIKALLLKQRHKCANCMRSIRSGFHVDHIMPLALGGSNWIDNIQLTCASCNLRKNAMHPIDFAQREGRLL